MDRWRVIICYANGREFCCFVGPKWMAIRVARLTSNAAAACPNTTEITNVLIEEWKPRDPFRSFMRLEYETAIPTTANNSL